MRSNGRSSIRNPAGYLISFVEGRQTIPPSFVTKRQRDVESRKFAHEKALKEERDLLCLAQLKLRERYENWCSVQAKSVLIERFQGEYLSDRLRKISSQLRENDRVAEMLDRMSADARREELIRCLKKEILKELDLPSIEAVYGTVTFETGELCTPRSGSSRIPTGAARRLFRLKPRRQKPEEVRRAAS